MTLSLKDVAGYSAFLAIGFLTLALLVQPPTFMDMRGFGNGIAFLGAFVLAWVPMLAIWLLWTIAVSYGRQDWVPWLGILLVAFGLSCFCKLIGPDPFPKVHQFYQFSSLAYGMFLAKLGDEPQRTDD